MNAPFPVDYGQYFPSGGLLTLARHGMYEMSQTYEVLRDVLGYRAHYVNFGYWPEGDATVEPGRELALRLATALRLPSQAHVLDAGCGLGQAAVDLCDAHDMARIVAVNPCEPQMRFATDLVQRHGCTDRIELVVDDACRLIRELPDASMHGAMMLECLSYFPDPAGFLKELNGRVLAPGGRVVFCVVTSERPQSRWSRRMVGFVSNAKSRPGTYFEGLLEEAGFAEIEREDITEQVIPPVCARARRRLDEAPERATDHHWAAEMVIRRMVTEAERSAAAGFMRYELLSATRG